MDVQLRRVRADEWRMVAAVKDRMVSDSPGAFDPSTSPTTGWDDAEWERWGAALAESEFEAAWCLVDGDRWVGFVVAALAFRLDAPVQVGWGWLWVDSGYRCRGLGHRLIATLESWATAQGAGRAWLWVADANVAAQRLYSQLGYRPTGEWVPTPVRGGGEQRWQRPLVVSATGPVAAR